MPPEISGHQDNRPAASVGGNDLTPPKNKAKAGPLTPDDIVGLSDEERQSEKVKKACDAFNKEFVGYDPAVVRAAIKEADSEITAQDLQKIEQLETAVVKCLERKSVKPKIAKFSPKTQIGVEKTGNTESPQVRNVRLGEFVETHFSEICPPEFQDIATGRCVRFEDQYRKLFEEDNLQLTKEDAADPDLKKEIQLVITEAANTKAIAAKTTTRKETEQKVKKQEKKDIPQAKTKRKKLEKKHPAIPKTEPERLALLNKETKKTQRLQAQKVIEGKKEQEKADDLSTVKQLQTNFNELRASKGTIGALKTLLGPDGVKTPEMKAIVQRVLSTASALVSALPGRSDVVNRILDRSNINLGATNPIQIFAGFLAEADKSNELTEDEKKTIRRIIGQSENDFQTGSDAKKIAHSKEQVIDPETGEVISEKYVHDSPENMAKIREYMGTYMDGERMMLASTNGSFPPRDVTGYGPDDLGLLAEALEFHSAAEQYGATGFVESIGNLHYDVLGNGAFNRKKLIETRQVISALMGPFEGHDGKVMDARQKFGLIKAQMRVIPKDGQAISFHSDEAGTKTNLEELGLQQNGKMNLKALKVFGDYTRENFPHFTRKDVQAHLHSLFPKLVKDPNKDNEDDKK